MACRLVLQRQQPRLTTCFQGRLVHAGGAFTMRHILQKTQRSRCVQSMSAPLIEARTSNGRRKTRQRWRITRCPEQSFRRSMSSLARVRLSLATQTAAIRRRALDVLAHTAQQGDERTAFRLERVGERLQLTAQAAAWPLRSFSELTSRVDERSTRPMPIGVEDRDFRLDRLPTARCAEAERRYVGAFTDVKQPSILSRVKRAASSREADGRKLCLQSVDESGAGAAATPSLRLFLDTGKYDWPVEVDEFTFRVTQTLGESRAVSSLSCTARTYAWRCEWRTTDDDREQKANRLANRIPQREETGLLLRGPTGAVLRGFSCLSGRCDHNDANDIPLVWSPPKACEVAP